ncbi:aminotransferase class IV [Campylobacter mucosalis]|uniref:aminotransferase class IV n=1 Tax=Campylobacter mucosalis TaxID=202 RepID=UPI00146FC8EB|nr:aminotransferase class IV [Campylobacter mucosalis]
MNTTNLNEKSTYLFETIRLENGLLKHTDYHLKRMNKAIKSELKFNLNDFSDTNLKGIHRLKVVYDEFGWLVSFEITPYTMREFREFYLVDINFSYEKKYLDRSKIDKAKGDKSEILMVKNGLITDTSIANIAILKDEIWLTPKTPLLYGTTRDRLIDSGFLTQSDLSVDDLKQAKSFAIMNAMVGFLTLKDYRFN